MKFKAGDTIKHKFGMIYVILRTPKTFSSSNGTPSYSYKDIHNTVFYKDQSYVESKGRFELYNNIHSC